MDVLWCANYFLGCRLRVYSLRVLSSMHISFWRHNCVEFLLVLRFCMPSPATQNKLSYLWIRNCKLIGGSPLLPRATVEIYEWKNVPYINLLAPIQGINSARVCDCDWVSTGGWCNAEHQHTSQGLLLIESLAAGWLGWWLVRWLVGWLAGWDDR